MVTARTDAPAAGIRRIGLTGGIGSGKSTVAGLFGACGAVLIDTDAIARSLTLAGGAAIEPLRGAFGDEIIAADGALDRARMRALAFGDPGTKLRLESILHPMIGAETARRADAAGDAVLVFDVPLLAESRHWRARVDRVVVVDCRTETQIDRVMRRSGWDRETVASVIAQQATRATRRACADAVLFNDGIGLATLEAEVQSLWRHWIAPPA